MKRILSLCLVILLVLAPSNAFALSLRNIVNAQNAVDTTLPEIEGVIVPDLAPFLGVSEIISGRYTFKHTSATTGEKDAIHNAVGYPCAGSYDAIIDSLIEYSEYVEEYGYELIDAQVDTSRVLLEFKNADNLYYMLDWDEEYDADHVYLYFPLQTELQIDFTFAPTPVRTLANYLGTSCKSGEIYEYTSNNVTVDGYLYAIPESTQDAIDALNRYVDDMVLDGFTVVSEDESETTYFRCLQHENKGYVFVDLDPEYNSEFLYLAFEKNMNFAASDAASTGSTSSTAPVQPAAVSDVALNTLSAVINGKAYDFVFDSASIELHKESTYYDVIFENYADDQIIYRLTFYFPTTAVSGDVIDLDWSIKNTLDWSDLYLYDMVNSLDLHSFVSSGFEYLPIGSSFSICIDSMENGICSGRITAELKEFESDDAPVVIESCAFSFELPEDTQNSSTAPTKPTTPAVPATITAVEIPSPETYLKTGAGSYEGEFELYGATYEGYCYDAPTGKLLFNNAIARYVTALENIGLAYVDEIESEDGDVLHFFENAAGESLVVLASKNEAVVSVLFETGSSFVLAE